VGASIRKRGGPLWEGENMSVLEGWDIEISDYYHTCGEKMVGLVKRDGTGHIVLSDVPLICPRCDSEEERVEFAVSHILNILCSNGVLSKEDSKKALYLILKAFRW
jgi:hypothetical protein